MTTRRHARGLLCAVVAAALLVPAARAEAAPAAAPTVRSDPTTLVNDPSSDTGSQDTQADPSVVAVGSNVVVGFTDSGSLSAGNHVTGWARSTNGGASFTDMGRLPDSANGDGRGSPVLAANQAENIVYLSTPGLTSPSNMQVFRSTDGGATFGPPVNATPGSEVAAAFQEVHSLAVDNFAGPCQGNVYLGWHQWIGGQSGGLRFDRSLDDGQSWGPSGGTPITGPALGAHIAVGPDQTVYYLWLDPAGNVIRMRRSHDCGLSWPAPPVVVVDLANVRLFGDLALDGGFATNAFPRVAVHPGTGALFVVFNDDPVGPDKADALYVASTDGGVSWSPPQPLHTPSPHDQFHPAIAFSADGAAVMVSWYDRRNGGPGGIQRFSRVGTAAGGSLVLDDEFVTSPVFLPTVGQDAALPPTYMGSYDTIAPVGNFFLSTWTDTRDSGGAHQQQPDIRFAKVPASGRADVRVTVADRPDPAEPGGTVEITAAVTNLSTRAADIVFATIVLPPELVLQTASTTSGSCYGDHHVVCRIGRLPGSQARTLTISATATVPGTFATSVRISTGTRDARPENNVAETTTWVRVQTASDPSSLVNDPNLDTTRRNSQLEPAAVTVGANVVVAFTDTGSNTGTGNVLTGWAVSTDGGTTFVDKGVLPDSAGGDTGQVALAANPALGHVYLVTGSWFHPQTLQLFRSTDDGESFEAPVSASPGAAGLQLFPAIAVDSFPGTCHGTVYVAWGASNGVRLTRSSDNGVTWGPNGGVAVSTSPEPFASAALAIGPDHAVYAFWLDDQNNIRVTQSTDCGTTFGVPALVTDLTVTGPGGDLGLSDVGNTNATPRVAVHPVSGALFVAFNDDPVGTDRADVFYVSSTDGAATWSTRKRLNGDTSSSDQFHPAIAFTADGAKAMVAWYDRRNDPSNVLMQRYSRIGTASGGVLKLGTDFTTSPAFAPAGSEDPMIGRTYFGRYDAITPVGSSLLSVWADTRDASAVGANQYDTRFAKVPTGGRADVSVTLADGPDPVTRGEEVTFTATVTNQSATGAAQEVFVTALVPVELAPTQATVDGGLCYVRQRVLGCRLGRLPAQQSRTITVVAVGARAGTATTRAIVTTATKDSDQVDNLASVDTTVNPGVVTVTNVSTGNIAVAIPNGTVEIPLAVSVPDGVILDLEATVRLNHTYDADLEIAVVGPDGTPISLSVRRGGSSDNFGTGSNNCSGTPTVFDDEADTAIAAGAAPFAGTFRPEHLLSNFHGGDPNGTWKLRVTDRKPSDVGIVGCFRLTITH